MTSRTRTTSQLVVALAALLLTAGACGSDADSSATGGTRCDYVSDGTSTVARKVAKPPSKPAYDGSVKVTMTTNYGDLTATLDAKNAPCAVNSFVSLAKQGYYDKTDCHRIVRSDAADQAFHIIQCGDPTASGRGGPGYRFAEELTGKEDYKPGSLALANTGQPNSSGAQFFIDYDTTTLPASYTQFGQLDAAGVAVAQKAAAAATQGVTLPYDGAPAAPVQILTVTVD